MSQTAEKMVGKPETKDADAKKEREDSNARDGVKMEGHSVSTRMRGGRGGPENQRGGHDRGGRGEGDQAPSERDFGRGGRFQGRGVSAGPRGVSAGPRGVSAGPRGFAGNRDDSFNRGQPRGMGRGRGRGSGGSDRGDRSNFMDQPQVSLEDALPPADKKFTGRCRLFVGNLPTDTTEDDFKTMFKEFGEFTEVFLNPSRGFGFIRMDLRKNAEAAKVGLDGRQKKNRTLRVRFATHGAALKVKYLPPHVTNELLAQAFSIFGELERAVIVVDDRGKPTGDGIIEFARKPGAQTALRRISEGVFLLGTSPRPIVVEPLEQKDDEDGYSEKFVQRSPDFNKEREQPPRFASLNSFEFEFGQKWKDLFNIHEEQKTNLQREFEAAIAKLEIEQAGAQMEHETQMLRQDLLRRQEELRRLEEMHQMELQKRMDVRHQEDQRRRQEEERRRDETLRRQQQQQEEHRQQELYMQQQRAMRELRGDQMRGDQMRGEPMRGEQMRGEQMRGDQMWGDRGHGGQNTPMQPPPAPPTGLGVDRNRQGAKNNHAGRDDLDASEEEMRNPPMRQSRFDQPPGYNQGRGGMGGGNAMGGMGQGSHGNQGEGMAMGNDRMMEGRGGQGMQRGDHGNREEYFDAKRARRY